MCNLFMIAAAQDHIASLTSCVAIFPVQAHNVLADFEHHWSRWCDMVQSLTREGGNNISADVGQELIRNTFLSHCSADVY